MTRRSFLGACVGTTAVARGAASAAAGLSVHTLRLGGPVEAPADPDAWAQAHRKLGYAAAYCPEVKLGDTARIQAIRDACARHNLVIAEVGRWVNLLDADPETRRKHLQTVTDGLALADEVDALCCVDIAGSFSTKEWYGPHPKNLSKQFFDAAVENAQKIIDAVKPRRAKFCYEMMGWALPDSADSCLELIRAVRRQGFGVHLDPCNLINCPARFYDNAALLEECFEKLGRYVVSCHAKDLVWDVEMNVHFREVRPGTGSLDYPTYLRRLARLPQRPPLMLEHLPNAAEYDAARRYLLDLGKQEGLVFG